MRFFALYENSKLIAVGTGYGGTEISEEEYTRLLAEVRETSSMVEALYKGEITIDDIPEASKEEVTHRVNELTEREGEFSEQAISSDEALDIILGGEA